MRTLQGEMEIFMKNRTPDETNYNFIVIVKRDQISSVCQIKGKKMKLEAM